MFYNILYKLYSTHCHPLHIIHIDKYSVRFHQLHSSSTGAPEAEHDMNLIGEHQTNYQRYKTQETRLVNGGTKENHVYHIPQINTPAKPSS